MNIIVIVDLRRKTITATMAEIRDGKKIIRIFTNKIYHEYKTDSLSSTHI